MRSRDVLFGAVFGFILSRAGATRPEAISGMFLLQDLHLVGVIGVAVVVAGAGFQLLRRAGARSRGGEPLALQPKPMVPGLVAGSALFGVGWALSGTCPGTALAQIGEGQVAGAVTLAGILAGAWLQARAPAARAPRVPEADAEVRPAA
ncbi:MAG TPA: DUF6691 family protein [Myxococcales bacterium]|nr:DUF6691 family protein [Myxococcales bacterium]